MERDKRKNGEGKNKLLTHGMSEPMTWPTPSGSKLTNYGLEVVELGSDLAEVGVAVSQSDERRPPPTLSRLLHKSSALVEFLKRAILLIRWKKLPFPTNFFSI